jgi:UTP-glucose-1-phosphate uridylyltransferase
MKKPGLIILAAGMGSRFGGLKQLSPIGPNGETIIEYSIYDAIRAGFGKVVFIIRKSFEEEFKDRFDAKFKSEIEVDYAFQEIDNLPEGFQVPEGREKPWGTGHAILMAKGLMDRPFAVINADDFYGLQAFQTMADFLNQGVNEREYSMVGYYLKNTLSENGSVSRGVCMVNELAELTEITERTNIRRSEQGISYEDNGIAHPLDENVLVSMNFWGFHPNLFDHLERLFNDFLQLRGQELKSEFYIPSVVFNLIQQNQVMAKVLRADSTWFGVTYQEDLPVVKESLERLITQGQYPEVIFQ